MVTSAYYQIDYIGVYLLVIAVLVGQAVYTWQFRAMPGAMLASISQICKSALLSFLVLASISTELSDKVFWISLQKVATGLLPYLWFLFVLQISRQETLIPSAIKYGVLGCLGGMALVLLTNWQGLSWRDSWIEGQTVWFEYGVGHRAAMVYGYLLALISVLLNLRWLQRSVGLRRRQAMWVLISSATSWVAHMLWFVAAFRGLALPLGFLVTGLILAWIYHRWHIYDILPVAQAAVAREMIDGLLVVDEHGYIVDINPVAKEIFTGLPACVGGKFEDLAAAWPALATIDGNTGSAAIEAVRADAEGIRHYQLHRRSLKTAKGYCLGNVIVLKNITRQKQDQVKLLEQEKALSVLTERNRLGRELHDAQGQFPGYVKMQAQAVVLCLQKNRVAEATEQLERLVNAADSAFVDARESITALKLAADGWDFFGNLQAWLRQFQKIAGIFTSYTGPQSPPPRWISQEAEVQLLRIIQEILTNARKHSGANRIEVDIAIVEERVVLTVTDNGSGFDPAAAQADSGKFGLRIIGERADEIGGTCTMESLAGQGTCVCVKIPFLAVE